MKKLPVAFVLAFLASHAHAQGLGVGLGAGGSSVRVGLGGSGLGVGANVGGLTSVGVGVGGGGIAAGIGGVTVGVGTGSLGTGVGVGLGAGSSAAGGGVGGAAAPAGATTALGGAGGGGPAIAAPGGAFVLPSSLRPDGGCATGRGDERPNSRRARRCGILAADVAPDRLPVRAAPGTPYETVAACRAAILIAATPYDPAYATTASGGVPRRLRDGYVAPIQTRLVYARGGLQEVREATVNCRVTAGGQVASIS